MKNWGAGCNDLKQIHLEACFEPLLPYWMAQVMSEGDHVFCNCEDTHSFTKVMFSNINFCQSCKHIDNMHRENNSLGGELGFGLCASALLTAASIVTKKKIWFFRNHQKWFYFNRTSHWRQRLWQIVNLLLQSIKHQSEDISKEELGIYWVTSIRTSLKETQLIMLLHSRLCCTLKKTSIL